MKDISNFTSAHNTTTSASAFLVGVDAINTTAGMNSDRVVVIQSEMAFRNSLGYGLGRILRGMFDNTFMWISGIYNALPNIGLPMASAAQDHGEPNITLSDNEALELVKSKIEIVGTSDKRTHNEILRRFLKVFYAARSEGQLTKDNFDIFLQYNAGCRFILHAESNPKILGSAAAIYRADKNSVHIQANLNTKLNWAEMHVKLIHEVGHAADDTRGSKAFQSNPGIIERNAYHHMDDKDAKTSKKLVEDCVKTVKETKSATTACLIQQKQCSTNNVKATKRHHTRPSVKVFSGGDGMKVARRMVSENAKAGDTITTPIGENTVLENTPQSVLLTATEPLAAFTVSA